MVNPPSKTVDRKDRESREPPNAPPGFPQHVSFPQPGFPQHVSFPQHGSPDMLLNILVGMQQQQQQQITLLQQQMTYVQHQLAAQQQKIDLQQPQQQSKPVANYFLKLKEAHAPTFAGSRDPLEAEKWITEMEKFCQALCIPKDEWVNVSVLFLIADAEAWFISVRPVYESGGVKIDWTQFRDIFFLNYFPDTFRSKKENEFFNLKQGSLTVIQYASMFNQLVRFAPAFMVQERCKVTRFEDGLNLNLREHMGTPLATTYQGVLEQALQAERLVTEKNQIRDSKRPRPWNEHYEETDSAANKKTIQEDLDCSTVHGQDNEKPSSVPPEISKLVPRPHVYDQVDSDSTVHGQRGKPACSTVHGQDKEKPSSLPPEISKLVPRPHVYDQVVRFHSLEKPKENEFCLELSKRNSYDEVVESVARHLSLDDPSRIRLTAHNCYSQHPKPQPIKYRWVAHLEDMLIHHNKTSDILYYEVLDIPLPELQSLKTLKVAFHYATKDEEVSHTITLAKQSTVGDVINHLKTKVELSHPNAELRLLQAYNHKIYKIFSIHEKIENIKDEYWILRAEEIPEEQKYLGPHDRMIPVFHFVKDSTRNQVIRNLGEPFLLVIHEGDTLAEVKSKIQKKLQVSDEEFSKLKFAFLSVDDPEYLQDSCKVYSRFKRRDVYGADEHQLGLEHLDNTPQNPSNQEIEKRKKVNLKRNVKLC